MRYRVSLDDPHSHLFQVELEVSRPAPTTILWMPVWTPGSYLVREFARHLEGVSAFDGAGEHARRLPVRRLDKNRFAVETGGAERLIVRYRVYANELSVRTCHLDGSHGYFNGAALLLCAEGREQEAHTLEVVPPGGPEPWRVSTALDGGPTTFTARDYDALVDAPVEVGKHEVARFIAGGKPHELALYGRGNVDLARLVDDTRRIVETLGELMGGLPYERYLFIVHLTERRKGGLEHAASTTLNVARTGFFPRDAYEETLALVAHEFFHLWNVKRLRPAAFLPYDYQREQYTRLLWWFEGVTSYYDHFALARAGLIDASRFLKHLGEQLTALERTPGARKTSLEDSSLTAWVKLYRPDENSPNSTVSYYLKGELVAFALDLALRRAGRSLDELLKHLFARHADGGLPEDGVERAMAELADAQAARDFFDRYVRGLEPFAVDAGDLERVGLRLGRRTSQGPDDKGGTPPRPPEERPVPGWLGAELAQGPKLVVTSVREGSPAHRAGLYAEDEIIAEDGFRVDRGVLLQRLEERGPAGTLRLSVFRRDELTEVVVPLAPLPEDTLWVEPVGDPTEAQRAAFRAWTGAALPPPGPVPSPREGQGQGGTPRATPPRPPSSPSCPSGTSRSRAARTRGGRPSP